MNAIPKEGVIERLRYENPWWEKNWKVKFSELTPRPYFTRFCHLVQKIPVRRAVLLMGPRRVGKTVFLYHFIKKLLNEGHPSQNIIYASLEHPAFSSYSIEDVLQLYLEIQERIDPNHKIYLILDEVQYSQDWELYLKKLVDDEHKVQCVVSGSAGAALRVKSFQSGAGRFTDFLLPSINFYEYLYFKKKPLIDLAKVESNDPFTFHVESIDALNSEFCDFINIGGYPETLFLEGKDFDTVQFIKNDIVEQVLLRDLPTLYGIRNVKDLNQLFTVLAYNTGNEFSLEEVSQKTEIAKGTIKSYFEFLEAAFLIQIINRVTVNSKKFIRAVKFKAYLTNTSLRGALFSPAKATDESMGRLVETAIFSHWLKPDFPLYYGRWAEGEVDLVSLNPNQKPDFAVEIKWSDRYFSSPHELKSLMEFAESNHLKSVICTTISKSGQITRGNCEISFMPSSVYSYISGYHRVNNPRMKIDLGLKNPPI